MSQKQYSLEDFHLISEEEGIQEINNIFLVKRDSNGEVIEYYASPEGMPESVYSDDIKNHFSIISEQHLEGMVSFKPDKVTIDAIYTVLSVASLNSIDQSLKNLILSNSNEKLRNKSRTLYLKYDINLNFIRLYYMVDSIEAVDRLEFLKEVENIIGKDIISDINNIVSLDLHVYYIFTEKENDHTMYIYTEIEE